MSGGSNAAEAPPGGTSATEALENAVEESRREYDKKVETMEEIDDKAMRSVRTAVILVGLVVSALSVSGPRAIVELSIPPILVGTLGVGSLTISIVSGIGTYTTSEYPSGVGSTHRADVITGGYARDEWVVSMLDDYDEWSAQIAEEIEANSEHLELVQLSLSFGLVSLLVSASMILAKTAYGVHSLLTLALVLSSILAVRTYLGNRN